MPSTGKSPERFGAAPAASALMMREWCKMVCRPSGACLARCRLASGQGTWDDLARGCPLTRSAGATVLIHMSDFDRISSGRAEVPEIFQGLSRTYTKKNVHVGKCRIRGRFGVLGSRMIDII